MPKTAANLAGTHNPTSPILSHFNTALTPVVGQSCHPGYSNQDQKLPDHKARLIPTAPDPPASACLPIRARVPSGSVPTASSLHPFLFNSFTTAGEEMTDSEAEYNPPHHLKAASTPIPHSRRATISEETAGSMPLFSESDYLSTPDEDYLSTSPAAAFLSGFTSPPVAKDNTTEGSLVSGYSIGETIGQGGFAVIKRATPTSGSVVAVKIVKRSALESGRPGSDEARARLSREEEIWSTLSHEHILPLFSVEKTPNATFYFMLFCPAGNLLDILRRDGRPGLPHDDVGMMFRQIVRGLRYLHEAERIVHGDIKPENILVDESGGCRIADFGLAHRLEDHTHPNHLTIAHGHGHAHPHEPESSRKHNLSALPVHLSLRREHRGSAPLPTHSVAIPTHPQHRFPAGSLPYVAPELLAPTAHAHRSDGHTYHPHPSQDIWALGCLLHALLTGALPFFDHFEPRLQMKIVRGHWDIPAGVGKEEVEVLSGCLHPKVDKRWSVNKVDEVAWSIGWGVAVAETEGEESRRRRSKSRGRPARPRSERMSSSNTSSSAESPAHTPNSGAAQVVIRRPSLSPSASRSPRGSQGFITPRAQFNTSPSQPAPAVLTLPTSTITSPSTLVSSPMSLDMSASLSPPFSRSSSSEDRPRGRNGEKYAGWRRGRASESPYSPEPSTPLDGETLNRALDSFSLNRTRVRNFSSEGIMERSMSQSESTESASPSRSRSRPRMSYSHNRTVSNDRFNELAIVDEGDMSVTAEDFVSCGVVPRIRTQSQSVEEELGMSRGRGRLPIPQNWDPTAPFLSEEASLHDCVKDKARKKRGGSVQALKRVLKGAAVDDADNGEEADGEEDAVMGGRIRSVSAGPRTRKLAPLNVNLGSR